MPRKNSASREGALSGLRISTLREALGMARTVFAVKIGIGNQRLETYEAERVPLPPEMVSKIKEAARLHLAAGLEAFRKTFGEDALPQSESSHFTTTYGTITMKLKTPLSAAQRRVAEAARAQLDATSDALNTAATEYHDLTKQRDAAQAKLAKAEAKKGASMEKASEISTLRTQIGLLDGEIDKVNQTYQEHVGSYRDAIESGARVVSELCNPLITQLHAEIARALAPFYNRGEYGARVACGNFCTADAALRAFLTLGRSLQTGAMGVATLTAEATTWSDALDALLTGGDVWSFTPDRSAQF